MPLINTAGGPVEDGDLGICLPAERIIDDPAGVLAGASGNREVVREWAAREFEDLVSQGGRTLIDLIPAGCGRDGSLMRDLQGATRLQIIASTGVGPPDRRTDRMTARKAKKVAAYFVEELTEGLDGSDARAGVISLTIPDAAAEEKDLFKAVGMAHEKTGAPVIAATAGDPGALIDALERGGVPAHCAALCNAGVGTTPEDLVRLAGRGVCLIFSSWGIVERATDSNLIAAIRALMAAGATDRIMLSVGFGFRMTDDGSVAWPLHGVPGRTYAFLVRSVMPLLRGSGFTEGDLWQLTVANPAAFLAHGGDHEETCRFCAHH